MDKEDGSWRKASYSNGSGECVEVGQKAGSVAVRDTKQNEQGPVLAFTSDAWRAFAASVKTGSAV